MQRKMITKNAPAQTRYGFLTVFMFEFSGVGGVAQNYALFSSQISKKPLIALQI